MGVRRQTEATFQAAVLALARRWGWKAAHFRAARTARGWRTAVQGDGVGFPDLVLARRGRLIVAELKLRRGRYSPDQLAWLAELELVAAAAGGEVVGCYRWTPDSWPEIEKVLT